MLRTDKQRSGSWYVWRVVLALFLLLAAICFATSRYKRLLFGDTKINELIFYLKNGVADGRSSGVTDAVFSGIPFALIVLCLIALPLFIFSKRRLFGRLRNKLFYAIIIFLCGFWTMLDSFGVQSYVYSLSQSSQLFEQYYVNPRSAALGFPSQKRNLIHIYLESMENTLASRQHGGQADASIIPELEAIALDPENVSFSNRAEGLGGMLPATGTTWTVGGMVAQSGGIPLKEHIFGADRNGHGQFKQFLPGAYMTGDVLAAAGYNQSFLMGSVAAFGGRDKLLTQHGKYSVQDYEHAKAVGKFPPNYGVWWGHEDKRLFQYAQEEATRLAALGQPFNLQLLTVDTHFPDGYLDETCDRPHQARYDNVYACSSKQVAAFVAWVRGQPFGDATTIIITGDHLGMQTAYYRDKIKDDAYRRTVYNAIINPVVRPQQTHNRQFTSFDIYPTSLAALGVTIPGNKLGLGVNLFSDQPTLVEKLGGLEALNRELEKHSRYYENRIMVKP